MRDGFGNLSDQSTQQTQSQEQTQSQKQTQSQSQEQTQSPKQTQSQSNGDSGLNTAAKVGIAGALIGGILLGILLAIGIFYWKRIKKSKSRGNTSNLVERMEGGASVQVLETRQRESASMLQYNRSLIVYLAGAVFPFVEAASSAQTPPREFRKERRLNGETYRVTETSGEIYERATTSSGVTSPHLPPSTPSVISAYPPPYAS